MTASNEFNRLGNKLLIDGDFRDSVATDGLEVIDPATEESIGHMPFATAAEVDEAIAVANRSHKAWNKVNALSRAELMHQVATNMRAQQAILGEMLTREMGKPYKEISSGVKNDLSSLVNTHTRG